MSAITPVTPVHSVPVHHTPAVSPQTTLPAKPVNAGQIHQLRAQGRSVSQVARQLSISQSRVTQNDADEAPSANTSGPPVGVTVNKTA